MPSGQAAAAAAEMRDEEGMRPQTTPNGGGSTSSATPGFSFSKREGPSGLEGVFGRGKYRLWALAAILLLAVWSMFTGSVTLKWSAVDLTNSSRASDASIHADLDVLDVDEREKMVRQMWDVYKHSSIIKLPSFWREAFGAAYQDLTSEVASIRTAALLEIAKMSFGSRDISDSPAVEPTARASKVDIQPRSPARKTRKQK